MIQHRALKQVHWYSTMRQIRHQSTNLVHMWWSWNTYTTATIHQIQIQQVSHHWLAHVISVVALCAWCSLLCTLNTYITSTSRSSTTHNNELHWVIKACMCHSVGCMCIKMMIWGEYKAWNIGATTTVLLHDVWAMQAVIHSFYCAWNSNISLSYSYNTSNTKPIACVRIYSIQRVLNQTWLTGTWQHVISLNSTIACFKAWLVQHCRQAWLLRL